MKKYLSKLIIFLMLTPCLVGAVTIKNPLEVDTFWELLDRLIVFILYLSMPIAVIMIIIAGYFFVIAAGDPNKITTAKQMILWTLIGLLVILCATGLIKLFGEIFGVKTPYNP